jgi:hypothetical protein
VSAAPPNTTFVSRGRLAGVVRQQADVPVGGRNESRGIDDLDTQAWEAVYYRARLVLGQSLTPPTYLQARGR